MENLLILLNKISQVSPLGVFSKEVIVVQNAGMQHWLNLSIAKERGISMNIDYALPAQYLWKLIRTLASDEKVPEQSPYSREVLTWRIYALLATKSVLEDDDFSPATRYWYQNKNQSHSEHNQEKQEHTFSKQACLKRYQLSQQIADLYEQYLIFRPQWLDSWQNGEAIEYLQADNKWQAKLWQLLINQLPYNPVALLNDAINNIKPKLSENPLLLPKRLSFFGLNSMAPMWLTFINALSEYIEVDFFHLNPCFSYWGDIVSEKQAIKKLTHWSKGVEDEHLFIGNPLLANLGQQGREFLALLQDYSTINVELFVKASNENNIQDGISKNNPSQQNSILHNVQNDILLLNDATKTPTNKIDDSITIVSCHSALREVQALHDFLLNQFNHSINTNDSLTPKDVLVMCPQIEQYAPYVNAVFTRGWQDLNDDVPPLPCSIADRSAKDSDPLIAAFSELLTMPDSRFQVTELLSYIRLPAVANKFSINAEDSVKISTWLEQASIHWGLNKDHKTKLLGEKASENFTWQQGLSRLLRGFSFADEDSIYQDQLLLSTVEGDDAILLGQLMLFIEQLQLLANQLNTPRNAKDWQTFLLSQLELLFAVNPYSFSDTQSKKSSLLLEQQINRQIENSLETIKQAISALVEYCTHAHYDEKIDLSIIVDFLNNHFGQGDSSRQFMIGQVTFCSMLPMRSIPFKIIAVLGLNDGEFPRQRQPLGFDLMAQSAAKLGDRSRRGDDRYLFLEAIISARKSLYLSYQGRNIKNNTEKQPSLVLKEFMEYLSQGYGWRFTSSGNKESQLNQLPMQPFSIQNYLVAKHANGDDGDDIDISNKPVNSIASFDAKWLKLAVNNDVNTDEDLLILPESSGEIEFLTAQELIRFYQHPSKIFAQQALNLFLEENDVSLEDVEPFSANYLERYLLKQALLTANLPVSETSLLDKKNHQYNEFSIEQVLTVAKLSGKFPDSPSTVNNFNDWLEDTKQLSEEIISQGCENPEIFDCKVFIHCQSSSTSIVSVSSGKKNNPITLTAKLPIKKTNQGVQLVFYRSSSPKAQDMFSLYLHQIIIQVWQQQNSGKPNYEKSLLSKVQSTCGFYFNAKSQIVEQVVVPCFENAEPELAMLVKIYQQGQKQALLLNGDIATQMFKKSRGKAVNFTQDKFMQFWLGDDNTYGFGDDPYIHYFWPKCPDISTIEHELIKVYQNLYDRIVKSDITNKAKRESI